MSAAARAEARRKAILSRGGDRLAKLTSSARGEDASAYVHDDPPLAPLPDRPVLEKFIGEQTHLPTPLVSTITARSSRSSPGPHSAASRNGIPQPPSQDEQMRQLRDALALPPLSSSEDDPLAAMMSSMAQHRDMPFMSTQKAAVVKPKTRQQKLMPFIHFLAAWALLAYFVLWREPETYESRTHGSVSENLWRRWAQLGWKGAEDGWGVQPVPFFWMFTSLTLVLHSWRIFSNLDTPQPPMLLALALPHFPSPIPSLVMSGLTYLQIGGIFLDDIAALLTGIGLLVWIAGWLAG